jgi:hypothetical protein
MKNQYKFSLIFPLLSSKDWKMDLQKKRLIKLLEIMTNH